VGDGLIAPDWWIQEAGSEEEAGRYRDERRVSVAGVVSELGIRGEFLYRYDMGDAPACRTPPISLIHKALPSYLNLVATVLATNFDWLPGKWTFRAGSPN
jgi:hypothetical protein